LGQVPTLVEIVEGAAHFRVDVSRGQKTGWYCDQRENRLAVAAYAKGARVLEAFCHTGPFGVHAALRGALSVEGLDSSEEAVAAARVHAELNVVSSVCRYRAGDVFEELPKLVRGGAQYDLVILDPPAFAKTKGVLKQALAGYKQINLRALQLLQPEGLLVTCSCSHHVSEEALWQVVVEAARDARRIVRLVETRSQSRDHPILAGMPETKYLKCFIVQVLERS
jgi:23S rRNA (cytosine1962-C5)-methyltransferase